MDREEAIEYLNEQEEISPKFSKEDEKKIAEVQKRGKIYGDPIVKLEY